MENFNFESNAMELIVYKLRDTLLNLINDITEGTDTEGDFEIPAEIKNLQKRLYDYASKIDEMLEKPLDERNDFIDGVAKLRKDIEELALATSAYMRSCEQMGDYMLERSKFADVKDIPGELPPDNIRIKSDISEFLNSIKKPDLLSEVKSKLISAVPMRMPRNDFAEYVQKSLQTYFDGLTLGFVDNSLPHLKALLCARKTDYFGKYFKNITDRINEVFALKLEKLKPEDYNDYLDDADYCINTLSNAYNILGIYFCDANYLLLLASFAVDYDFMFENDFVLKDLYFGMRAIVENSDNALPKEDVNNAAVKEIEERYDQYKNMDKQVKKYLSSLTADEIANLEPEVATVVNAYMLIDTQFKMQLDFEIMGEYNKADEQSATKEELAAKCADVTKALTELIADMPIKDQKFIKQKFLSAIPCPLDNRELLDYIGYSLDGINDKTGKWVAYGNIFEIFDKCDFKPQDYK
jgi:hypothetical protein